MATPKLVKCRGLYTSGNRYAAPEGALVKASDVLILRDGIIRPRWQLGGSTAMAAGGVSYWHRQATLNGYVLGIGRAASTVTLGTGTAGSTFAGMTANLSGIQAPDGFSNYTSATATPYFDNEFVSRGTSVYLLAQDAVRRLEYDASVSSTTPFASYRAGGYSCAVSCFPRPFHQAIGSMAKSGSAVCTVTTPFAHGYVPGVKIKMTSAGEVNFPAGERTILTVPTSTSYTYNDGTVATATNGTAQIISAEQLVGSSGFLALNKGVAYRACIVEYDSAGKEYVREASGRIEVYNASPFVGTAADKNVQLAVLFTRGSSNAKVELYRTRSGDAPDDEPAMVFSKFLTEAEMAAGVVWITDITPDSAIGAKKLYINESVTSKGAFDNHWVLPACKTVGAWGDRMVQANIIGIPNVLMTLRSVDSASGGLAAGDVLSIYTGVDKDLTAIASTAGFTASTNFTIFTGGSVASTDVRNTVLSLVDSINWGAANPYRAVWESKPNEWPGGFRIKALYPEDQYEFGQAGAMVRTVSAKTTGTSTRDCFAPKLGAKNDVSGSPVRATNSTTITTASNHNFEVGEYVVWYTTWSTQTQGSIGVTAVEGKITSKTANTIVISNAGADGTAGASGGVVALKYRPLIIGERSKSMIRASVPGTNEAFTETATIKVGSDDAHILKVWGLDETLLVFKEDGLFKVTASGFNKAELSSELLDPTAVLWAKDSVASVGGKVYAWLRKGVARIGSGGVEAYVSLNRIDDKLSPDTDANADAAIDDLPFSRRAYAIGDDTLGVYELRACMTYQPSAPYASTVNLIYCPTTDTWVEDTVAATGGCISNGLRYFQVGTAHKYQQRGFTRIGVGTTGFSGTAYDATTKVVTVQYSAPVAAANPAVGDTARFYNFDTDAFIALGKVVTTGTGTGTKTATIITHGTSVDFQDFIDGGSLAGDFYTATTPVVEWAPITLSSENTLKNNREVQILWGVQSLLSFSYAMLTELVASESNTVQTTWDPGSTEAQPGINDFVPVSNRLPIPQQHRTGQQLSVRLTIPTALETWTILGIGVDGASVGPKVAR